MVDALKNSSNEALVIDKNGKNKSRYGRKAIYRSVTNQRG